MSRTRASIPFIFVCILLDMVGVGLILPVLPSLVGEFTQNVEAKAYWYGALTLTFGVTQFACAPLLGALSDRFGRRPVLLLSIGGLGSSLLLAALVRSLPALVATRVLSGALASNVSVANAYVADVTPPEQRAKSFGLLGAAFGIGFILGPVVGGVIGDINIRLPFYLASGLGFLNFLYGVFVLPESLERDQRRPFSLGKTNPFSALVHLTQLKNVGMLVMVIALINLAQFVLISTWVLFTTFRFDWGPRENGVSLFMVGLTSAIVQGALLGWLIKKLGEQRLALAGIASATLTYIAYGLAPHGWMVYAIIVANLLAFAVPVALTALISKAAPPHAQGLAMGSLSSLNSLITVLGPLCGIPIFARVSRLPHEDFRVGAPFFLSAVLSAIAFILASWHFARQRAQSAAQSQREAT